MISAILNSVGVWITIGVLGYTILEVLGVMNRKEIKKKKKIYCEECCWFRDDKLHHLGAMCRYRCTNPEFRIQIKNNKFIATSCDEEIYDGFCTDLNGNGECRGYKEK